ncbi:unnamed protein product, partial [Ectocarpus sp. 12 AP-2014]
APKLKLKDYTVRLPRASRDQDMKQLRRAARDNEGVGESDPVYPLTGPACITRKEAAAALLSLGEERDDAMVAAAKAAVSESSDCGAGVRSTIADGSIPFAMGINQPLLAEAEADDHLASPRTSGNLTTEDQRSSLPHPAQLYHAQDKPDSSDDTTGAMSAAAKIAPARAGDVAGLSAAAGCGGGGAFDGVVGGGVGGGQGRRVEPEHGVGGSTSSNKYKHVIGDGDVGGDSSMVDRLGKAGCVWGSSTGHHGQGGDGDGKAGAGCYGNGGGASGDHAESDGAHTSGSRGYSGGYSGLTTSDDNDSSSGGDGNGFIMTSSSSSGRSGGHVGYSGTLHLNSRPDEGKGCDGPSSASSPSSPSRDSCLGKQKRENSNDDGGGGDDVISKRVKTGGRYYSYRGGSSSSGGSGSGGVTISDGNDSSSSSSTGGGGGIISASSNSSSSSTGGGIAWDNATDNTGGCDVSSSELSPPSPSRDISSFGKRKRGHDDNDDDDDYTVDGSGCVDVNTTSGDDGASERCAKRARQAAGGQSRQLGASRDRSGK